MLQSKDGIGPNTIELEGLDADDLEDLVFGEDEGEEIPVEDEKAPKDKDSESKIKDDSGDSKDKKASKEDKKDDENLEDDSNKESDDPDEGEKSKEEEGDELPLVDEIKTFLQRDFGFDNLEGDFPDTIEGISQLVEQSALRLAQNEFNAYVSSVPELKNFVEFLQNGGDADKYVKTQFPAVKYNEIEIKEDDTATQKAVLRNFLKAQGYEDSAIKDEIEESDTTGTLFSRAQRAKSALARAQQKQQQEQLEKQREEAARLQREAQEFEQKLNTFVDKATDFAGLPIATKDKKQLLQYITPGKDGVSQRDKDMAELDMEKALALSYLLLKKFDLSDFIDTKAESKRVQDLRSRLKKEESGSSRTRRSGKSGVGEREMTLDTELLDNLELDDLEIV